jgi:AraC-like DNA-binding protein
MIGQFRTQDPPPERSESLQRAFRRAPRRERLAPMLSIFDKLVDHMLATHKLRLLEELFVERARRYAAERVDRQISIERAAKDLGVSVSGLCHRFKAETGESFIAYHRRHRLEAGIDLLEQGAPVKEASSAVGFADPLHFSRAVKAMRGVPPSALRGPASSTLRGQSLRGPAFRDQPQPAGRRGRQLGALPLDQRDGDADGQPAPGAAAERGVQVVGDPQGE